jgi:hypothetical protein
MRLQNPESDNGYFNMTIKTRLHDLVASAKIEEALTLAKEQALAGLSDWDTPVTLLQSAFQYLQRNARLGLISLQEEAQERQQIAHRLLSLADDQRAAAPVATAAEADKEVILFLGANPFQHLALELEREVEEVSRGLAYFGKRAAFDFRARMHVSPPDLQRMLLETGPSPRFVHFAGNAVVNHPEHGSGLIFEDEQQQGQARVLDGKTLAGIFRQFPGIECVFLNTCDSGPTALEIGQHIPYAIGMNARVFDEAAIQFAVAFYEAVASGKDIPFAFEFARNRLRMSYFPEQAAIPVLITAGQCPDPVYTDGASHLDQPSPRLPR